MLEGAQAVFLEGTGLEMRSSGTKCAALFWCTIFAWGEQFLLGGRAQAVILRGMDPKCPPMVPGLCFTSLQTP